MHSNDNEQISPASDVGVHFFEFDGFAIEAGVGEVGEAVAKVGERAAGRKTVLVRDVTMPEDEKVDLGGLEQVAGEQHRPFLVVVDDGRQPVLFAAAGRPRSCNAKRYPRVQHPEHALQQATGKAPFQEIVFPIEVAQTVAVSDVERFAIYLPKQRPVHDFGPSDKRQIIEHPHVVVATEERHLDARIGKFTQLDNQPVEPAWDDVLVLEPEIEHVADKHHLGSIGSEAVQPCNDDTFTLVGRSLAVDAQMCVGNEIYLCLTVQTSH